MGYSIMEKDYLDLQYKIEHCANRIFKTSYETLNHENRLSEYYIYMYLKISHIFSLFDVD